MLKCQLVRSFLNAKRLRRNPDFGGPSRRVAMGRRHPDAVPVAVLAVAAWIDQRVVARAARIDLEDVARAAVEKRVEDDLDVVLVAQRAVALLREGDDIAGVRDRRRPRR